MDWTLRTCWNCNSAHEHLKSVDKLHCVACGTYYEKGKTVGKAESSMLELLEKSPEGQIFLKALKNASTVGSPLVIEHLECTMDIVEYTKTPVKLKKL